MQHTWGCSGDYEWVELIIIVRTAIILDITPKTICGYIIYTLVTGTATRRENDVPEVAWGNLFSDHFW